MGGMYGTSGESQNELRQNWQVLDTTDSKLGIRLTGVRLPSGGLLPGWSIYALRGEKVFFSDHFSP